MKVNITVSLDISRNEWAAAFGGAFDSVAAMREDVRAYVLNLIANSAAALDDGAIRNVELKSGAK